MPGPARAPERRKPVGAKEQILELWRFVQRPGIDGDGSLIEFLEESDFFRAPCSTVFHLAKPGGLAEHSLNVYYLLKEKWERFNLTEFITHESVIICALGHDLCKVNFYVEDVEPATPAQEKYLRDLCIQRNISPLPGGDWTKSHVSKAIEAIKAGKKELPWYEPVYKVQDQFPMGHGEKSVSILQDYIWLNQEEKLAIRWHMGMTEAGTHFDYPAGYPFRSAQKGVPLVTLLHTADQEASQILEAAEE